MDRSQGSAFFALRKKNLNLAGTQNHPCLIYIRGKTAKTTKPIAEGGKEEKRTTHPIRDRKRGLRSHGKKSDRPSKGAETSLIQGG